jgi:hypothetical protein
MSSALTITSLNGESFDLRERLREVAATASDLSDLTPELVLGLSSAEVARLRRGSDVVSRANAAANEVLSDVRREWATAGRRVFSSGQATLVRCESAGQPATMRRVVSGLAASCAAAGGSIVLEEISEPYGQALAPIEGMSVMHLLCSPASVLTSSARRATPRSALDSGRPSDADRDDPRNVFLDGQLVARVGERPGQAYLWVVPWVAGGAFTAGRFGDRVLLMSRVVEAIRAAFGVVFPDGIPGAVDGEAREIERQNREAVALIDMIPTFVAARDNPRESVSDRLEREISEFSYAAGRARTTLQMWAGRSEHNRRDLDALVSVIGDESHALVVSRREELERARQEVASARQLTMDALRQRSEKQRELEQALRNQGALSTDRVLAALMEVYYMRQLLAVHSVRVSNDGRVPSLKIALHPVVIRHSGSNYLMDKLEFEMRLDGAASSNVTWTCVERHGESPHPHVSTGGSTCWGAAASPLDHALRDHDYSTAVTFICAWARLYNNASPYVSIQNFPVTGLDPGFHPEVPLGI